MDGTDRCASLLHAAIQPSEPDFLVQDDQARFLEEVPRVVNSICEERAEEELQRCDDLRTLLVDRGWQLHRAGELGLAGATPTRASSSSGLRTRARRGASRHLRHHSS